MDSRLSTRENPNKIPALSRDKANDSILGPNGDDNKSWPISDVHKHRDQKEKIEELFNEPQNTNSIKKESAPGTKKEENWLVKLAGSKFIRHHVSLIANLIDFSANSISALANLLPISQEWKDKASQLGSNATKFTLLFYDAAGAISQIFKTKNLLAGCSYLLDMPIVKFFKQKDLYTIRGITNGINLWAFGSSYYDADGKHFNNKTKTYESYGGFMKSLIPNIKRAFAELSFKHMPKKGNFFQRIGSYLSNITNNMFSNNSGLIYIFSGFGLIAGTLLSLIKPLESIGKAFRNAIGVVPDFARIRNRKVEPNNFKSGVNFILSAVMNSTRIGRDSKKLESIVVPLEFAFTSLARHFHLMSQNNGETTDSAKENSNGNGARIINMFANNGRNARAAA